MRDTNNYKRDKKNMKKKNSLHPLGAILNSQFVNSRACNAISWKNSPPPQFLINENLWKGAWIDLEEAIPGGRFEI